MTDSLEDLRGKLEALDATGAVVNRIEAHFKTLSAIPLDQQTNQQKLWLLGYSAVNEKMARPWTEEVMAEVGRLLPILDGTTAI